MDTMDSMDRVRARPCMLGGWSVAGLLRMVGGLSSAGVLRLLGVLLALVLVSCEEVVNDVDWPDHAPLLVVRASLALTSPDSAEVECLVRHTVPLSQPLDADRTNVTDATVQVYLEGDTVQLRHIGYGTYHGRVSLVGARRARLEARWNGRVATSELDAVYRPIMPDTLVEVPDPRFPMFKRFRIVFTPLPGRGITYSIDQEVLSSASHKWLESMSYTWRDGATNAWDISMLPDGRIGMLMPRYSTEPTRVRIRTLSAEYEAYDKARYNEFGGDILSGDPVNPFFNVRGDGIGFFWSETPGAWHIF